MLFLAVSALRPANSPASEIAANPHLWESILWPVILGLVPLFLYVVFKCIVDVEEIRETNSSCGSALFKRFWLAPDFLVLAIGLAISSNALNAVLVGRGLKSNYGSDFDKFFWILITVFFVVSLLTLFIWLVTGSEAKTFPIETTTKNRLVAGGVFQPVQVYEIKYFKGLFRTRVGFWNMIVGNGLGVISILAYCAFIYFGFIRDFR
jgi:hypothetical protein